MVKIAWFQNSDHTKRTLCEIYSKNVGEFWAGQNTVNNFCSVAPNRTAGDEARHDATQDVMAWLGTEGWPGRAPGVRKPLAASALRYVP